MVRYPNSPSRIKGNLYRSFSQIMVVILVQQQELIYISGGKAEVKPFQRRPSFNVGKHEETPSQMNFFINYTNGRSVFNFFQNKILQDDQSPNLY